MLDDSTVLTESAGIVLWIADRYPEAQLLPDDASARALAFRWIVSFSTNIYGPIIVGDFPERWVDGEAAHASLKEHALQRLKHAWLAFEEHIKPSPYLLGRNIGALDVYSAMISRPGRAWLAEHCPKAIAAIQLTERHPVVAPVWARNF